MNRWSPSLTKPLRMAVSPGACFLTVWILLTLVTEYAAAARPARPYVPASDQTVLEVLPTVLIGDRSQLADLRKQLADQPDNPAIAAQVARRYLQLGTQANDPRFFGYARAALQPWWDSADPLPEILKVRAKIREKDHLYDAAVADLKQLLAQRPQDMQAWMELANISRVQGNFRETAGACDALSKFAGPLPVTLGRAPLQAVTGEAEAAYESLASMRPIAENQFPSTVQWILTMQAQIASSLGRDAAAEQHFRDGLHRDPSDNYLLRAFADFLTDRGRPSEAVTLLQDHVADTGVLLCAAIAARRAGMDDTADEWQSQLKSRFEESKLRGSEPHGRFEARFALHLENDPAAALALSLWNWEKQKEPQDARIALESAIAAGEPAAVRGVIDFLAEHKTQDVSLRKLLRQLED